MTGIIIDYLFFFLAELNLGRMTTTFECPFLFLLQSFFVLWQSKDLLDLFIKLLDGVLYVT